MRPRRRIELSYGRLRFNTGRNGIYRAEHAVFVCPLPCVAIKVWRTP